MRVTIIDCGSRKVADIADLLGGMGLSARVVPLTEAHELYAPDALVISGGPRLFTSEPALVDAFAFLDLVRVPVLGICLGHQALGLRDGARVFLGEERRGRETVHVTGPHAIWQRLGEAPVFLADHTEGIELPDGWECLARSEHYGVEAMVHTSRPRIGVQFHPEVSPETGPILLANFVTFARAR